MSTNVNHDSNANVHTTATEEKSTMPTTTVHDPSQSSNPSATAASPGPANPPDPIYIAPPPPTANIPLPPTGYVPSKGNTYRGVRPKKAELVAMPDAVAEIRTCADWTSTMGKAAYPQVQVVQSLDAAQLWSTMRNSSRQWDAFCRDQEGIVWTMVRQILVRLRPSFDLAVAADPTVATRMPKLASFLGVKKSIAKKSATTRAKNSKATAAGLPATHGAVGKKRKVAAEKAAIAAALAQQHAEGQPAPAAAMAPAAAPAATPAPKAEPAPAGGPSAGANGGTANGVAHS
jgi:hypothetical protein